MPTYVFECQEPDCGGAAEVVCLVSEMDKHVPACPKMRESAQAPHEMKRVIQRTGLIFKGSGWTPKFGSSR
jgi:predicted nucleic acid-binding Zn ribbon protein